jgi:hypothetical protein
MGTVYLTDLEAMRVQKNGAYFERNQVVAALAKLFPSGTRRTAIEGWSEDWHGCVYIDLPTGQVSWHYHDSSAWLFAGLPEYKKPWDGHDTEEKYRRVNALVAPSEEAMRADFENKVFNRRFIASININSKGGMTFSDDCPTRDELLQRDEAGGYVDDAISAMWFGYRMGKGLV